MASFTFRRAFRLFLPTAVSTLLIVFLLRIGLYEWTRDFAQDGRYMRNVQELHYGRAPTTLEQLQGWGRDMFSFVHIWSWEKYGGSTGLDPHLWTIPVEFRGSMMLFITLVGTARLKTWARFVSVALLAWFSYRNDRWEMLLFYAGMALAEIDLIRGAHTNQAAVASPRPVGHHNHPSLLSLDHVAPIPAARGHIRSLAWTALSIIALYLMSQPDIGGEATPGWGLADVPGSGLLSPTNTGTGSQWDLYSFVLAVGRMASWQRFFNLPAVQYFGKISYAIYLMHGPVLHTVGYATMRAIWERTGTEGTNYTLGFVLSSFLVVPMVIWAADIFWRAVDAPIVRFAKWLEANCSISE